MSVDREHPMAGVVLSIFPHAEVGSRNDDPISTMEANEALGLSLAFMVPATGREAQLTRATSQSGGMRKFKMPLDKINAVMDAVGEAVGDLLGSAKTYIDLREAVLARWSRLQDDPRMRLQPGDITSDTPPAPDGAPGRPGRRRTSPRPPPPRPRTRRSAGSSDDGAAGGEGDGSEDDDAEAAAVATGSAPRDEEPDTWIDGLIRLEEMLMTCKEAEDACLPLEALGMLRLLLAQARARDGLPASAPVVIEMLRLHTLAGLQRSEATAISSELLTSSFASSFKKIVLHPRMRSGILSPAELQAELRDGITLLRGSRAEVRDVEMRRVGFMLKGLPTLSALLQTLSPANAHVQVERLSSLYFPSRVQLPLLSRVDDVEDAVSKYHGMVEWRSTGAPLWSEPPGWKMTPREVGMR